MMRTTWACLLITAFGTAATADWNQFMGPNRDGVVSGRHLPPAFPEGGPKEMWSAEAGAGFGGVAIRDGRVYLLDREDDARDVLRCLDLNGGREIWRQSYDVQGRLSYAGSRSTPTVDDDLIFTCGGFGHVTAFDRQTGSIAWQIDLRETFKSPVPNWGFAQSPLVRGEHLIVAAMSREAGLVALDKRTGQTVWRSEDIGGDTYVTPRVYRIDDTEQIVFVSTSGVASVDPDDGRVLWRYEGYKNRIPIPNPTQVDAQRLFITGGYGAGSVMVRVSRDAERWNVAELWRSDDGSQIHPAIYHKDHLYLNGNTNETLRGGGRNAPGLMCFDLDGNVKWRSSNEPEIDRGGMIVADGQAYLLAGQSGMLHLIGLNPQAYRELDAARVIEGDKGNNNFWGPMALSDGYIVPRDQQRIKCFDLQPARQALSQ